jgi:hypothetical protein
MQKGPDERLFSALMRHLPNEHDDFGSGLEGYNSDRKLRFSSEPFRNRYHPHAAIPSVVACTCEPAFARQS